MPDHFSSAAVPFAGDGGALVQSDHPWVDAQIARLYDVFPFDADVPFYTALAAAEGGRVLEVACGSGRIVVPLARACRRVVGLDASPHMLSLARAKLVAAGLDSPERVRLIEADMRAFALGETFDLAIIAVKSFAYLTERADQLRSLQAVADHLRPGGVLAVDLLHPSPEWLSARPGSLNQDLVQHTPELGATVARTETTVSTDLARQVRVIRSAYEIVSDDGSVKKRFVEWPYRFTHRFEAEHLLERAGLTVDAVYGGYRREPFRSESAAMVFVARRQALAPV